MFVATADFNATEAGDLPFKKGDRLTVIATRSEL